MKVTITKTKNINQIYFVQSSIFAHASLEFKQKSNKRTIISFWDVHANFVVCYYSKTVEYLCTTHFMLTIDAYWIASINKAYSTCPSYFPTNIVTNMQTYTHQDE